MAISPIVQYPTKVAAATGAYPYGQARNITTPSDGTGTPWEAALVNDLFGFQQALLKAAAIVPSGSPEQVGGSEYLQSIVEVASGRAYNYDESGVADAYVLDIRANQEGPASLFDGLRIRFRPVNNNTGASTVNPGGLGVTTLRDQNGAVLDAGVMTGVVIADYNSSSGAFEIQSILNSDSVALGGWNFNNGLTRFGVSTPGDPFSAGDTLEIGENGAIWSEPASFNFSENAYYNSGWKYKNTDSASLVQLTGGGVRLLVSPPGTADTPVTWNTALKTESDGVVKMLGGNCLFSANGGDITPNRNVVIYEDDSTLSVAQFINATTGITANDGLLIGVNTSEEAIFFNNENTDVVFSTNQLPEMFLDASTRGLVVGVGAGLGVGTIESQNGFYEGGVKFNLPTVVSGYSEGQNITIHEDAANNTNLNASSVITASTWESVGPTGSLADNIWTALDDVPDGAKAVKIRISARLNGSVNAAAYSLSVYARSTGSGIGPSSRTQVTDVDFTNNSGASEQDSDITEITVPLDSLERFDIYWNSGGSGNTPTVLLYLVGWIE